MVGAWCFDFVRPTGVYTVGFLLLRYSVLFTVESLSLLYLPFISWFICSWRWCFDKLNQLSPPVKYFYWPFQGGASFVDHLCYFCLVSLCFHARLFIYALWSPAGKGLTSWLSFVMSNCDVVTFLMVSWVRCCAWLYIFMIFALFLTFIDENCINSRPGMHLQGVLK